MPQFSLFLDAVKCAIRSKSASAASFLNYEIQRIVIQERDEAEIEAKAESRAGNLEKLGRLSAIRSVSDIPSSVSELHSTLASFPAFSFPDMFLRLFEEGMTRETVSEWDWDWEIVIPFLGLFVNDHIRQLREKHIGYPNGEEKDDTGFTEKLVAILNNQAQTAVSIHDSTLLQSTSCPSLLSHFFQR